MSVNATLKHTVNQSRGFGSGNRLVRHERAVFVAVNPTALICARDIFLSVKGDIADFVSRFFAPLAGIPEDPVTGSAHSTLIPFWAARLGKKRLTAQQLSVRGGTLTCENCGARVKISGRARLYLKGEIFV